VSRGRRGERGALWACVYAGLFGVPGEETSADDDADGDGDSDRPGATAAGESRREEG
jgi:hypothetical protein